MNTQAKMSIEEETTQRLVENANRLAYTIVTIDTTDDLAIEIRPAACMPYTPPLYRDWQTGQWTIQTTSYGSLDPEEIEKVTDGYRRAIAMVSELAPLNARDLVNYSINRNA
ncbi:hypothetical protein [Trueperella pyogenes]|uniref:hypothetical protein n=1 Tax=Trueperella pyogenes TaxID=1661 RepID=UPI003DA8A2FF